MLKCPKCGEKIPFYKSWYLTSFNHIKCVTCGKSLYANKKISSRITVIGIVTGMMIIIFFKFTFSLWMWMILLLWFLCALLAFAVFTKFEDKE